MIGFISKMFGGSKSEKDIKQILPIIDEINHHSKASESLTNDQLRNKTQEFKQRIREHLSQVNEEIARVNKEAEDLPFNDITGKDTLYQQVDALKKDRDKQIEVVLEEILPEAFAVVKETARRFKENTELVVTASDLDKDLSIKKEHIRIEGNKAIFKNTWMAARNLITWNMVHYDVQLIGGYVLHSGKISEM
ncbi:MAG TPA: preprotein translocase subunit SecA, partial [Chitinophagaceae bacterium]|nr:preprotein translocase subunit SecA [Chitinophagaceae bacterium]